VNITIRNPQFMALIYRLFFAIMGAKVLDFFAGEPAKKRVRRLNVWEVRRRRERC